MCVCFGQEVRSKPFANYCMSQKSFPSPYYEYAIKFGQDIKYDSVWLNYASI